MTTSPITVREIGPRSLIVIGVRNFGEMHRIVRGDATEPRREHPVDDPEELPRGRNGGNAPSSPLRDLRMDRESCDTGSYRVWTWTDSVRTHLRYAEPSLLMHPYLMDDVDWLTVGTSRAYAHSLYG